MNKTCRKCQRSLQLPDEEIEKQIKRVIESGVPITSTQAYEKRLEVCSRCDKLIDGTTCMICGCLVRVRAIYALRICPNSSGSKW